MTLTTIPTGESSNCTFDGEDQNFVRGSLMNGLALAKKPQPRNP